MSLIFLVAFFYGKWDHLNLEKNEEKFEMFVSFVKIIELEKENKKKSWKGNVLEHWSSSLKLSVILLT